MDWVDGGEQDKKLGMLCSGQVHSGRKIRGQCKGLCGQSMQPQLGHEMTTWGTGATLSTTVPKSF